MPNQNTGLPTVARTAQSIFQPASRSHTPELIQIILINSLAKNRYVHLPVAGGVAVTGTNAGGKTSLLRLVPVFYGAAPGSVVRGSSYEGVRKPFAEYYLETPCSYIAFEYRRHTGELCMAVLRNMANSPRFFMVASGFRKDLFVEGSAGEERFVESNRIINHIDKQLGGKLAFDVENLSDYPNIIMGSTTKRRDHALSRLVQRFSMVMPDSVKRDNPLLQAHHIALAMLSREVDFKALRGIILASASDGKFVDEATGEAIVSLDLNSHEVKDWTTNVREFRKVQALAPRLPAINDHHNTINALAEQLHRTHLQVHSTLTHAQEQLQSQKAKLESEKRLYDEAIPSLQEARNQANTAHTDAQAEHDRIKRGIELIRGQKLSYDQSDIQSACDRVDEKPRIMEKHADASQRFETLTKTQGAIKHSIDQQKKAAQDEALATRNSLLDAKSKALSELSEKEAETRSQHETVMGERQHAFDSELTPLQAKLQTLNQKKTQIETSLARPKRPEMLDEAFKRKQDDCQKAQASLSEHDKQSNALGNQALQAARAADKLEAEYKSTETQITSLREEVTKTLERLNPAKGSLHEFLVENVEPDTASLLGRILRQDVLSKTNLDPHYEGFEGSAGIYGLEIDTTKLPTSYVDLNKSALERAVETANSKLNDAQQRLARIETEWQEAQAKQKKIQADLDMHTAKRASLQAEFDALSRQLSEIQAQIKAAIEQEREELKAQLEEVEKDILSLIDQIKERETQHRKALEQAKLQLEATLKSIKDARLDSERLHKQGLEQAEQRLASRIEQLDRDLHEALKAEGIDPELLTSLSHEIKQLEEALKEIAGLEARVSEYRRWLKAEWQTQLPAFEKDLIDADKKLAHALEALNNAKEALQKKEAEFARQSEETKARISKYQAWCDDSTRLINNFIQSGFDLEEGAALPEWEAAWTPEFLHGQFQILNPEIISLKAKLESECKQIINVFGSASPNTQVRTYHDDMRLSELRASDPVQWLNGWYAEEGEAKTIQSKLISMAGMKPMNDVNHFTLMLENFHAELRRYNDTLQKGLASNVDFEVVRDVKLHLTSGKLLTDMIASGKRLSKLAQKEQEDDGLPNSDYLREMESFSKQGAIRINLGEMIEVKGEVVENGTLKTFKNARDLKGISSNGGSYLVMILMLVALSNGIRAGKQIKLHWPLDEVADLHKSNTKALVKMLKRNHIELVVATPDQSNELFEIFRHVKQTSPNSELISLDSHQKMSDFITAAMADTPVNHQTFVAGNQSA